MDTKIMSVEHLHAVPHLTTALTGPLLELEEHLLQHQGEIEQWFRSQWLQTPAPFYTSVDLRNAGFKLAPVDTNLFPAGYNNLNRAFEQLCIQAIQSATERVCPKASKILLIPENHTRNKFYLESVAALVHIITQAGFEIRVGSLLEDLKDPQTISLPSGHSLTLEPVFRKNNRISVKDFDPCFVLLNNDLSGGRPAILEGLDQPVMPPPAIGWSNRLKSDHLAHYGRIAREFGQMIDIDPWLIDPIFRKCGKIDFHKRSGEDCLVENVADVLSEIKKKYDEYGIAQQPYALVKADAGTYGMGIMTVHDAGEIRELNRKKRNKMAQVKEGHAVTDVLVQEGVYTFETWGEGQAVAEPVVYLIDHFVVGGFYRVHKGRSVNENLNAPGMHFEPLAFAESGATPDKNKAPDSNPNRFYAYGVIARLASLAAARELQTLK